MTKHSSLDVGTSPYWADSVASPLLPKIDRDIDVDVVVIGGGITGLTTAYLLLAAGKSVAVLERAKCARDRHWSHDRASDDGHRYDG